ncbi:MAG: hypothetical protein HOP10_09330 [Chitinophagaceae bacterium]|nr:hypothetical protein [Chitinophagaceae bacterium]
MDKKMFTIILAVVVTASFFLDWGHGASAFDIVKGAGPWEKYVLILIPLSGVLLLIGALNNGNYPLGRNTLCWLPLLAVLFWIIGMPLIEGFPIGDVFKSIGKGWGIGHWIAVVGSLVLALYNPK